MVCALSQKQEARLLKKISRDLLEGITSKTPFELDAYIKSLYDEIKKSSDKEDLALTYAALIPRSLKIIFGGDPEIDEYLENSIVLIQKKSKEFADFDNVLKQIIGDPAQIKKTKEALKKAEEQKKAEEDEEKVRPSAAAIKVFSELPNSFNTTIGNPDSPVFQFSYSYLRHQAAQTTVDSDVTGVYLTMGRAQDLLPESVLSQFKREPQYVHILTDFDGNTLYFNDQFEQVSQEEGQPVFFNERIKESQIQSIPEIMKAYGFETEEEVKELLAAQVKEAEEKKEYILSGSGKRIIQNIIGANHSYIKTTGDKKNLNTVADLSMYPIRIDQEGKKTVQGYAFDRGQYMMPIKFKMRSVKSDMEFVETAADILLGNVVDVNGKAAPVKLLEYRNKFYKVFLGNNSRLNFKDGVVYVDKNATTSKEEIIEAITTNTIIGQRTGEPMQVDNVFQVYKTTLSEVPFYTIVDGQIRLSPSGMTGTEYRKFIQDHAYTTMDINESGQFNEFGGYYIFAQGTYRQVQGEVSTTKPTKVLDSPTFKNLDKKPVYDLAENTVNTLRSATGTPYNFGNPFRGSKRYGVSDTIDNKITYGTIQEAVNAFKQWLDGTAHQDVNPEQRAWILEQIDSGQLNGKTLLYYKPKSIQQLDGTKIEDYYSHADYLADLVNSTVPQEEFVEIPAVETPTSTQTVENITKTEEEDFNFVESKKIDLDDTLKQFDKLKGQKLINSKVTEEQLKAAKEWYESDKNPLKKHVSLTELFNAVNSANPLSIATFNAMGITLYKGADYSDLYHEAWHAFTQMFLTQAERDSLYKEFRKRKGEFTDFEGNKLKYSDANDKQAEEVLAEEFREFMLSGGKKLKEETPIKKTIFQKIFDILRLLFNVNTEDILARDQSSTLINDMFEALRVGNIRSTPLGVDNSQFTNLDKIKALNEEQQKYADELGYENSIKVVNLIDGLFSEFIDEKVNKGKDVNYTVAILSQPETRAVAYNYALSRIKDKVKELTEQINSLEENDPTGIELKKRRAILVFAIRNFAEGSSNGEDIVGDTLVNITAINSKPTGKAAGIVSYHMEKSKFLSFEDRYELLEAAGEDRSKVDSKANPDEADNTTVNARDGYSHKSGNEVSMKELAANEVLYLIRSLFDYKAGKVVKDEFGFSKLGKFDENWNKIQKLIGGINNAEAMYKKMLTSKDPVIKQLTSKLGDPRVGITPGIKISQNRLMQSNLWTKFFEVFSSKRIPLVQLTIDISTKTGDITVKPGRAQAEIDKISRDWDAQFTNPQNPNKFIITKAKLSGTARDKFTSNYLDVIGVVKAFEKTYKSNPIAFLRALGMIVSDESEIELALKTSLKIFPETMMKSLQNIKTKLEAAPNSKFKIYKPSDLVKFQIEEGKTETSSYKELLTLESRYSETYGTAMVSNAKGDSQYELSLRSTGANMIDYYNSASSLEALVANPAMNHLSPERNPWTNKLMIIRETFDPTTGKRIGEKTEVGRQKSTYISLENSSGITVTLDEEFSELGIKSADADDTAQMLQQFYTMSLYGVSEATKHSDKSSVFFFRPQFASGKRHYIPSFKFASYSNLEDLETEKNFTDGNVAAVNQFVNYLAGEVERIYKLQNGDVSGNVLIGDKTYKEVGSDFVMFEDILEEETINKIKEKGIVADFLTFINDPANASLLEEINTNISNYITDQVEEFKKDAAKVGLLSNDKLMAQVRKSLLASSSLSSILSKPENQTFLDEAVMRNYVINQLIHTTEMTLLFYGDIALYNLAKEEFHKRNAGIAATGNFMRIDEAMLQILNAAGTNYSASAWYDKEKYGEAEAKVYGRTANSAILQDSEIKSVYTDEYIEALIENEKVIRGVTELSNEVIEQIKTTLSPYNKLTEGDAQGWVSFDFYRAMRMSLGKWDWYQETLYNKILRKEPVSTLDVIKFFPVEKMQYWGPLQTEGLNVVGFHKFSLMPLIPNVIEGTNLEILHNRMTQQNIDYALFQSGSKVNTITKDGKADKFYVDPTKQETNAVEFSDPAYRFTKNTIFLDYFKNQLETADQYKGKQIFSTQLRKLIEEGLMEQGVPTDFRTDLSLSARRTLWESLLTDSPDRMTPNYEKLLNYESLVRSLTEYKVRELHRELGFGANDDITISENLINFVTKELTRQDLADHEIDFIRYNPVTKSLMYDLSIHPSAEKIEKLLTAVVYKRLIKQKVNGEALIQVSGAGFEPAKVRKATAEEKETYGSNGLPFYQKGKAMKVKIALQGDFKKLLKDEEVVKLAKQTGDALKALNILVKQDTWLNKGDNRKMVTIAGVRIPVQGFNSMEFAEIYEFLPESAGNMIIVPSEIVGKAGSDFDIDKLTMLFPSIVKTRKGLSLAKHSLAAENIAATVDLKARLKDLYAEKEIAYREYQEFAKKYFADLSYDVRKIHNKSVRFLNEYIKAFKKEVLSYSIMGEEIPDHLYDDIQEYYDILDEVMKEFSAPVREYKAANLDPIQEQIDETKMTISQASSKGIENDLLFAVVDIMSADRNFADLITPNSTDILQPIAEDISKYTRDYDPFMSRTGKEFTFTKGGKKKKRIAGTRIIEIGYNRFKHVSNNIGKKTLGQGAVDNTYNTLFSRIGFYMNAYAQLGSGDYPYSHKQTLFMPHHTVDTEDGAAISLSNLYTLPDKDGRVYRISNLISQAMNGWVDVAKDAWIFDIQANPELTGALLFMIQAGVPPTQAIYLISQPLVREYVKERRKIRSAFAKPLGDSIPNFMMYKNKAKANILGGYDPTYYTMPLKRVKSTLLRKTVNELFNRIDLKESPVLETGSEAAVSVKTEKFNPEIFSEDSLYKRLEQTADDYKSGTYTPTIDDYRRFVHFLEIEEMSDATTKIKLGINVDTARTTNLFETREKLANIIDLYDQARFPAKMIKALENESPIGSFRVQEDIIKSVSNLFKIRDNQTFSRFVRDETPMFEDELHTKYPGAFKNKADFQSKLRNDFIPYVFQQWLYKPGRFSMYNSYKGLGIKESPEAAEIVPAGMLSRGAFLDTKTNKLNVDFSVLSKQFEESVYETEAYWNKLGFAPVSSFHFLTGNSDLDYELFVKFLYERETLRAMIPYKKYKESENFKSRKEEVLISGLLEGKKSSVSIDELAGVRAYEEFLRDTALINKLNLSFMFRDPSGYSSQLSTIDQLFPQLKAQYSVLNILSYKTYNGTFSIGLNQKDLTSDDKSIYNDQLKKLADPNVQKVENSVDNDIISRMFSMLPIFSFVQTGMDTKSVNSLAPIIDTTLYERLLFTALKESPNMFSSDSLGKYKLMFNTQYSTSDEAGEKVSYRRKGFKNYYSNFFEEEKVKEFTESAPYDPNVKLFTTQNKDLKVFAERLIASAKADTRKLFIYDDYLAAYVPSPKAIPGMVSISKNKKPISTYNTSAIKDMAGKGLIDSKQAVGFIVKKRPTTLDESDFLTDATLDKNKEAIDARISIILDRIAEGYIPQFSESGVGNALLGISGREIKGQSGSITKETPPALQTYLYLSKELYRHFGYINPLAKQYEEMVEVITEKQTITDDDVKNVLYSCFFK